MVVSLNIFFLNSEAMQKKNQNNIVKFYNIYNYIIIYIIIFGIKSYEKK